MYRPPLLLVLLASTTALTGVAWADTLADQAYPEVGSWGQAWGDPAAATPPPAPVRPVVAPTATASAPAAAAYPEVGSWGQAWGGDHAAAPATPPPPPVLPDLPPVIIEPPLPPPVLAASAPQPVPPEAAAEPQRPAAAAPEPTAAPPRPAPGLEPITLPPRFVPPPLQRAATRSAGPNPPVRLEADEVTYDHDYDIVTARGRVVLTQTLRTIQADSLTYNLKQDLMGASGHVILTEPSGEITTADYLELTGDMKAGVASQIRLILADDSRLTAATAQRSGGNRIELKDATYTACEPCRAHPDATPLWQVKADQVTHNQTEAEIEYDNVWFELAGVPVFYSPYLSHPDPTIQRKSGFLSPSFGSNSTLGVSVTTPYYFVLSDQEDLTLAPRFMLDKNAKLSGSPNFDVEGSAFLARRIQWATEHRWLGASGESLTRASIIADRTTGDPRGHIDSKGVIDLDETWRAGWQVQYQSDDTYRTLYKVRMDNDRNWLLTRPYLEGFSRRGYTMVETLSFQGQQVLTDGSKATGVAPHIVDSRISSPGWAGSYWTSDSDMLVYTRTYGAEARRLSQRTAWTLPVITRDGQLFTFNSGLRVDGYDADRLTESNSNATTSAATTGRALPDASLTWSYPFSRTGNSFTQVIEPLGMIAVSPVGGNGSEIPNEDSIGFELDETNVLRPNRLVGLDRVEGGLRGGYGLRWAAYPSSGGKVGLQVAQGWRRHLDSTFQEGSGFTDNFSDYLGRLEISPNSNLTFSERIRLDKDTMDLNRNEASMTVGSSPLSATVSYGFLSASTSETGTLYSRRQYVTYAVGSSINKNIRSDLSINQDLEENGGIINVTSKTSYNDECFGIALTFDRYFTTQDEVNSGFDVSLSIILKTLGQSSTSLF